MFLDQIRDSASQLSKNKPTDAQLLLYKFEAKAKYLLRVEYDLLKLYSIASLSNN